MPKVLRYAESQARSRARIGAMPDASQWRRMAQAQDLDELVARMHRNGLTFWVAGLPRTPDALTIERHLQERCRALVAELGRLLPPTWAAWAEWLRLMPELVWVRPLVERGEDSGLVEVAGTLGDVARPADARRREAVAAVRFAACLGAGVSPEAVWLESLVDRLPRLAAAERRAVGRVVGCVRRHLAEVGALRHAAREAPLEPGAARPGDAGRMWALRARFGEDLRALLAGNPFHAGTVIVYGLLEVLQLERVRALLIAKQRGWDDGHMWAQA